MLIIRYRSAITGQYVTKAYADQHPDTTIRETSHTKTRVTATTARLDWR